MAIPKIIKAGGGERAQFLTHEHNDSTIRFVLNYPGVLDVDVMRKAVKALVESVDVLHGTFFTDGSRAYWKINKEVDESNYFLYVETDGDPAMIANSLAVMPVYAEDKVQLHCSLIKSREKSSLCIRISHLVVDGGDGKYLVEKLVEAYNRIAETGNTEGIAIKDGNRAPEQVYDNLSLSEINKVLAPPAANVRSMYPYPSEEPGRNRIVHAVIPSENINAARKKAKAAGATVNDMLMAATYHAYAKLDAVDASQPMGINAMMDLRRHCTDGESEGLSNISGTFMTILENGCTGTFEETLQEVSRQSNLVKENPLAGLNGLPIGHAMVKAVPMWLLLQVMGKVYGAAPVGVTNLGNLKCADFTIGGIAPNGGLFGGPLKKKPGMQISVISFDGDCVLSVVTQCTDEDAAMLKGTLDEMVRIITEYSE